MASCDTYTKWIQRVSIVAGGGSVPIVFPTTAIAKTQTTNTTQAVAATTDVAVLAANANRKFAQIVNLSGTTMYIAFGAAAVGNSLPLPSGGVFTIDVNTLGQINQQAVHVYNASGGSLNVQVYEE